jgi:hypothetical protein
MAPRNNKKPAAQDDATIAFELGQELLVQELRWFKANPDQRVPSALLTAALAAGKATGVADRAKREMDAPSVEYDENGETVTRMSDGSIFKSRVKVAPANVYTPVSEFDGILPDDWTNIARRARYLAGQLEQSNPERDRLLIVAKEAEARSAGEAKNEQQQQQQ